MRGVCVYVVVVGGGAECGFCVEMLFHNKSTETSPLPPSPHPPPRSTTPVHQAGHRVTGQSQPACLCFTNTRSNTTTTSELTVDMLRNQPAPDSTGEQELCCRQRRVAPPRNDHDWAEEINVWPVAEQFSNDIT